jgi:GNAT superfamily N-acetyltransferase
VRRTLDGGFELDDDPERVDVEAVHAFISERSYWGRGRSLEMQRRAIQGSAVVVGLYLGADQVGFARGVSDGATVGYLADVYVLEPFRGRGLGLELVREVVERGPCADVRWLLHTGDAQELYAKLGFAEGPPLYPLMERGRPAATEGPAKADSGSAGGRAPRPRRMPRGPSSLRRP